MSHPAPLVVVEHDAEIATPIVEQLVADGYRVQLARTAEHMRVLARADTPRATLLGELQPAGAALALLLDIRRGGASGGVSGGGAGPVAASKRGVVPRACVSHRWPVDMPVIVISSRTQMSDVLRAFEAGADDFLARPPVYLELRARLRALLLRAGGRHARTVQVGPLTIDLDAHTATVHGRPLPLRRLEYELLLLLAREPQRVFSKQELMRAIWRYPETVCTRTVDSHSSRLRRKLRVAGVESWVINVRGVGYRLI